MRFIIVIGLVLLGFNGSCGDSDFKGTWQGVMMKAGQSIEQGTILYADFKLSDGVLSGHMREEVYDTEYFAVKMIDGTAESGKLSYNQLAVTKNKKSSKMKWCRTIGELSYDSTTGYLTGSFRSNDCKRLIGKIILYRSKFELSQENDSHLSHLWLKQFFKDYRDGLSAPAIRKIERDNFVFKPIFFDFDKSNIRDEHNEFLDAMIKIVKGHTDLRVRVKGHTDAEGSDGYNVGLSKRRAEAIIQYFVDNGLNADRLEFEFHGEKKPAATNDTSEGRQRNRRVDFEFI